MTDTTVADGDLRLKTVIASLVAPLLIVPTLVVVGLLVAIPELNSLTDVVRGALHAGFFFALFGLPVAYAVEGALLVGALVVGTAPSLVPPRTVVLATTLAGGVTFFFLWVTFVGGDAPSSIATGAGMGLVSGAAFVALRDGRSGIRNLFSSTAREPSGSTSRAGA